ncbi:RNA-binding protein 5-A [Schistosoma japonicum]|nr:RNA-binding protein 5-A [Schistosoma japonicum]
MKRAKQDRELTEEERNVVISVRHCARELDDILQGARRKAQSNAKLFAETGISVMFRGVDSYADMYEKLAVKSRDGLERLFSKFSDCEEIQDTQDAIEETEGNWRNFLINLDKEVARNEHESDEIKSVSKPKNFDNVECDYLFLPSLPLIDWHTNREVNLLDYFQKYMCLVVICQPAYWPDTAVRWRYSEVSKAQCDLSQFKVGYVVVTWGPANEVRSWSKQVNRITKWPVLWDKSGDFRAKVGFKSGLQRVWAAENLDFLGCQRSIHNRPINPPPSDLNWSEWKQIGGELVLAQPVLWNPQKTMKSINHVAITQTGTKHNYDDNDDENLHSESLRSLIQEALRDKEAIRSKQVKVCALHLSTRISDLMPSGQIYQAALTCYARTHNTTESEVMDKIRRDRRFSTPPESARLQYETTTGLYYDPETALYYDPLRGYFYDSSNQMYYYWSQSEGRYILANTLIQAELAAAHVAQAAAARAAADKAMAEREAAKKAALCVAAQLAEIRAGKNDYAAYAYATCVLPQQEPYDSDYKEICMDGDQLCTAYQNTTTAANNIEASLKAWNASGTEILSSKPLVPYTDDSTENDHNSSTPPPPGL